MSSNQPIPASPSLDLTSPTCASAASPERAPAFSEPSSKMYPTHSRASQRSQSHLSHIQSREISLGAEGVLAVPEAALDAVEKDSSDSGDPEKGRLEPASAVAAEPWTYPDGGLEAWRVVLGAHIFACCQMGYGMIWGVLVAQLAIAHPSESSATLNMVIGLSNFAMSGCALVSGRLAERFGYKRMLAVSMGCCFVSLVLSGLVYESLAGVFVCQGALLGISLGLGTPIYLSIPSQWFLKRRGLATGFVGAGAGFGGAVSSLIVRFLIPVVGYRDTLVIYGSINLIVSCLAWQMITIRLQPLRPGERRLPRNWLPIGIWRDPTTYSLVLCVFLGTFGFLNVPFFATSFTLFQNPTLDKHSITAAVPLIVGNVLQGVGRIGAGFVADLIGPVNAYFASYFMGGVVQIAMWPRVKSLGQITAFTALYNLLGAWFMVLLPVVGASLFGVKGLATLTGLLLVANSPGQLLGGTLGGVVLDAGGGPAAGGYARLAYYSGSMMLAGALALLYARFDRERRVFARF